MRLFIDRILKQRQMSQTELAERLDVSRGYLSLLVNNKRDPSPALLQRMADVLDVTVADLIDTPPPGFADAAAPFEPGTAREKSVLFFLRTLGRQVTPYKLKSHAPTLSLLTDDILAVDLSRKPKTGDIVIAAQIDEAETAHSFAARIMGEWLQLGDPKEPPLMLTDSGAIAVLGPVVGSIRI